MHQQLAPRCSGGQAGTAELVYLGSFCRAAKVKQLEQDKTTTPSYAHQASRDMLLLLQEVVQRGCASLPALCNCLDQFPGGSWSDLTMVGWNASCRTCCPCGLTVAVKLVGINTPLPSLLLMFFTASLHCVHAFNIHTPACSLTNSVFLRACRLLQEPCCPCLCCCSWPKIWL